jgi:hypothetical protein
MKTEERTRSCASKQAIWPARRRTKAHDCRRRARSGRRASAPSPPQLARFASASSRSSSCAAEGDKLIGGFGFGFWVLGSPPGSSTRSQPDVTQPVPFRSSCVRRAGALGSQAEVDRAQPQAEAAEETPGGPTCQ